MKARFLTFGLALFLVAGAAVSAGAQTIGAGVSFIGDERGVGVLLDYSSPFASQTRDYTLGWVGEFNFNHRGFGNDFVGVTGGINTLLLQGGVRATGTASEKISWQAQGLVGLIHSGFGTDAAGVNKDVCDLYDIDCSTGVSDNGAVLTIGGGVTYALTDKTGIRGQLDFPIAIGADGGGTTRFSIVLAFKR